MLTKHDAQLQITMFVDGTNGVDIKREFMQTEELPWVNKKYTIM